MADTDRLFATEDEQADDSSTEAEEAATEQFLIFRSDALLFGVNAGYTVEIITNYSVTPLPIVPNYVRGILNLRGQIIPVVDIRLLLGKPFQENDCIIVLNIDGTQIGILVDSVAQMISLQTESILTMPIRDDQKLVSGMCALPDGSGTMLVFDCTQLLEK